MNEWKTISLTLWSQPGVQLRVFNWHHSKYRWTHHQPTRSELPRQWNVSQRPKLSRGNWKCDHTRRNNSKSTNLKAMNVKYTEQQKLLQIRYPSFQVQEPSFRRVSKFAKSDHQLCHFCLYAWNNTTPTVRILMTFDIFGFFEHLSRKLKFH